MKTFNFDAVGNLTVSVKKMGVDKDGKPIEQTASHDIQPAQLAAHMPMFEVDMSLAEKYKANGIIDALKAK